MQRTVTQHVDQIENWLQAHMLAAAGRPGARVLEGLRWIQRGTDR